MREHNTCSPIFFPPQICHGRRMRFINACCKNRCASLPPQGGGHGVFQRVFRRLSGILIGRGCRNRFPKTRSPCDLRVRGLRAPRNVEKISARFVPPRTKVSGSWYRSLKWRPEGISESCAPIRTRGDSAIKMEQRGGRDLSRPFMRGGGKKWRGRRGKVVKKKGGTRGNSLFLFFFFRVTVGHVQNLNHPPRPAIRFISGEVSRGFRAAS